MSGEKNATFRVNDDKDIKPNDRVQIIDKVDRDMPTSWLIPGEIKVLEVRELPLNELFESKSFNGESFKDKDEMVQTFKRFYGEHISIDSLITVFGFEYNAYEKAKPFMNNAANKSAIPKNIKLYADGGSRGNPGPSAAGFVVLDSYDALLHADNKYLGVTTNNQAEYHALISGLDWCRDHGAREVQVFLDSMLVVNQLKGIFKVKNRDLWSLYEAAKEKSKYFNEISFTHVPRELNKLADKEVNKALDAVKGSDVVQ